jgi:hypothetical protein
MIDARIRLAGAALGLALTLVSTIAEAQWVLLARRAIGRIEQVSQPTPGGAVTVDTSTVIVDAPADKVYARLARSIRDSQRVKVSGDDAASMAMQFTDGVDMASVKVSVLGDGLAQLVVSATNHGAQPAPMAAIVDRIIAVCGEIGVECRRAQQP